MFDPAEFAKQIWSEADLGDARRTRRAVAALEVVAGHPTVSFVKACQGNTAQQEKLYRFVRDPGSSTDELIDAGCLALARHAQGQCRGDIAVLSDTTSGSYQHGSVRNELGDLGGKENSSKRGFFTHVSLAVDAERGTVIGPLDMQFAIRPVREPGHRRDHRDFSYQEKESFKWEASATAVEGRCSDFRERLIFISDRESDVYEYLMHLVGSDLRFVVRSCWDRRVEHEADRLHAWLAQQPSRARVKVHLDQKGGRPAREVVLELRGTRVSLNGRKHSQEVLPPLELNAILLTELEPPAGVVPIEWLLFTTEAIESIEQSVEIVRRYCLRWLVEEYNKCCKSDGTDIESLRMQTKDALLRAVVLCAFAAVPIMHLRADLMGSDCRRRWPVLLHPQPSSPPADAELPIPCSTFLPTLYWVTLWRAVERNKPLPTEPPDRTWALLAVAKLGGWIDSKRTKRPGYPVLWDGWDRLIERVDAVRMAADTQNELPTAPS